MKKLAIAASIVLIVAFVFYKKVYIPKHTFKTTTARIGDIKVEVSGIGNVGAKNIYKIGSVYSGKLSDFNISEGQFIQRGELVATVDSVDLSDKIQEQKALKEKLIKDIDSLKVDKQSAEVNYELQLEIYKKNLQLLKNRTISPLDLKKSFTVKESAKLKIKSIQAHINSLQKQILQIDANIKGLQKRLALFTIESPVSGYVTKKMVSNYQIVMPNQTLIEIVNPKELWVATHIDTRVSGNVKVGDSATIKLQSKDKVLKGKVVQINPINNPITYEREIDVAFNKVPIPFYLEEQAKVKIYVTTLKGVVKIDTKALSVYDESDGVWVLKGDRVYFKKVKILAYDKKMAAVDGISKGSRVVIPDPKKKSLKNGMKIYHD